MRKTCVLVLAATLFAGSAFAQDAGAAASALKIVVVKGEDAVNIIQQKTAVAPIVEVRDHNNLPVPGATVTFSLTGQGASFAGGAQSLTVVTNAAGQAAATGFTPTAAGAVNISATATFQGQTAIATIAQTNVMTAADVAGTAGASSTAGGSGGGGGGGGGAAGGGTAGGGGMSGTTLGIIGAVAGTGAAVGVKAASGGDSSSPTVSAPTTPTASTPAPTTTTAPTTPAPTTPAPTPTTPSSGSYSGPMDGTFTGTSAVTITGAPGEQCTFSMRMTGNSTLRVTSATGPGNGTLDMSGRENVTVNSCGDGGGVLADVPFTWSTPVDVSGNNVTFRQEFRDSGSQQGFTYTSVSSISFTGTISSGGISGTLTFSSTVDVRGDGFSSHATWNGTMPINLK